MNYDNGRRFDGRRSPYGYPSSRGPVRAVPYRSQDSCPCERNRENAQEARNEQRNREEARSSCGCQNPQEHRQERREERREERRSENRDHCGCERDSENTRSRRECPDMVLAMSYVLTQQWSEPHDMSRALQCGTIFPELDKPFMMGRCRK